jgi:hypothetical protein
MGSSLSPPAQPAALDICAQTCIELSPFILASFDWIPVMAVEMNLDNTLGSVFLGGIGSAV